MRRKDVLWSQRRNDPLGILVRVALVRADSRYSEATTNEVIANVATYGLFTISQLIVSEIKWRNDGA